jgi:hypothetical protein
VAEEADVAEESAEGVGKAPDEVAWVLVTATTVAVGMGAAAEVL